MIDYRTYVRAVVPPVLKGPWGTKLIGVVGTLLDTLAQSSVDALTRGYLRRGAEVPNDVLVHLGNQRNLNRYPSETPAQYRARIDLCWQTWIGSGGPQAMVDQLAAAGWPGAVVMYQWTANLPVESPVDWWSQFWVFFPFGTHPATGAYPHWDEFDYGDGTVYGPLGLTKPQIVLLRGIIRKWKPGNWICRNILFEMSAGGANAPAPYDVAQLSP